MRITHLRLRDFLAYREVDLDLLGIDQIAIAGHVGAGKSTLLDGIMWSLFGEGRKSADQMIRKGQKEAYAGVDCQVAGRFIQVGRTRRLNRSTSLTLAVDNEDLTQHTVAETQAKINDLIGLPYEALMAGPIMVQGKSDELMRVPASERRDLLGRLFGLDRFEVYHEAAKQRLAEVNLERNRTEAVLEEIEREIDAEGDVLGRSKNLEALRVQHEALVDGAESVVAARQEEATALVERSQHLNSVETLISTLQQRLTDTDTRLDERTKTADRFKRQAALIDNVPCGGQGIYATCPLLQLAFKAKDEVASISFDDLHREYETIAGQLSGARQERLRLTNDAERVASMAELLREADAKLVDARAALRAIRDDIVRTEAQLERIKAAQQRRKAVLKAYNQTGQQIAVYQTLAAAFHRNGIPSMELERRLPIVEAEANQVLERLPGSLSLRLVTEVETKAKTSRQTLEIVVDTAVGELDYGLLSGGERFQIDFALRLGVSAVQARRSGHPTETLWLDEGWGTQDEEGREAMLQAIAAVADRFGLIVLISHVRDVTDRFPVRLDVAKRNGVSHAQIA